MVCNSCMFVNLGSPATPRALYNRSSRGSTLVGPDPGFAPAGPGGAYGAAFTPVGPAVPTRGSALCGPSGYPAGGWRSRTLGHLGCLHAFNHSGLATIGSRLPPVSIASRGGCTAPRRPARSARFSRRWPMGGVCHRRGGDPKAPPRSAWEPGWWLGIQHGWRGAGMGRARASTGAGPGTACSSWSEGV